MHCNTHGKIIIDVLIELLPSNLGNHSV